MCHPWMFRNTSGKIESPLVQHITERLQEAHLIAGNFALGGLIAIMELALVELDLEKGEK